MRRDIENWLESKVLREPFHPIRKIGGMFTRDILSEFYANNDFDIKRNDIGNEQIVEKEEDREYVVSNYDGYEIYIDSRKPRSHTHALFIEMLDCIYDNEMFVCVDDKSVPILSPEDKRAFYNFCYLNRS